MRGRSSKKRILVVPFAAVALVVVFASVAWACVTMQGRFQVTTASGTVTSFGSGYHPYSGNLEGPGATPNIEYCKPPSGSAIGHGGQANTIQVTVGPWGGCHWVDPSNTESQTDGAKADVGEYFVRLDIRDTWCNLSEPDCPPGELSTPPAWRKQAGWFRLSIGPEGEPITDVGDLPAFREVRTAGGQCYRPPTDARFLELVDEGKILILGTMNVDERGHGSKSFTIPQGTFSGPTNAASVCTREIGDAPGDFGHPGPPHAGQVPLTVI